MLSFPARTEGSVQHSEPIAANRPEFNDAVTAIDRFREYRNVSRNTLDSPGVRRIAPSGNTASRKSDLWVCLGFKRKKVNQTWTLADVNQQATDRICRESQLNVNSVQATDPGLTRFVISTLTTLLTVYWKIRYNLTRLVSRSRADRNYETYSICVICKRHNSVSAWNASRGTRKISDPTTRKWLSVRNV